MGSEPQIWESYLVNDTSKGFSEWHGPPRKQIAECVNSSCPLNKNITQCMCSNLNIPIPSLHSTHSKENKLVRNTSCWPLKRWLNRNLGHAKSHPLLSEGSPTAQEAMTMSATSLSGWKHLPHSSWTWCRGSDLINTSWKAKSFKHKAQGRGKKFMVSYILNEKESFIVCWEGGLYWEPSISTPCLNLAQFLSRYPTEHGCLLFLKAVIASARA